MPLVYPLEPFVWQRFPKVPAPVFPRLEPRFAQLRAHTPAGMDTVRTYLLDDGTRLAIDLAGPRASLAITGSDSWTCLRTGTACAFGFLRHIIGHADTLAADIGETTRWRVHCETNRTLFETGDARTRCQTNITLPREWRQGPFTGQKHDRVR